MFDEFLGGVFLAHLLLRSGGALEVAQPVTASKIVERTIAVTMGMEFLEAIQRAASRWRG